MYWRLVIANTCIPLREVKNRYDRFYYYIFISMAKRGKAYRAAREKVSPTTKYPIAEAISLTKEVSISKFVGAVELHVKTAANPKYNDQMLR